MFTRLRSRDKTFETRSSMIRWDKKQATVTDIDKRLFVSVILQAIDDLGSNNRRIVKSADEFLSGRDGALYNICDFAELNYLAIVNRYKELGGAAIKKVFSKAYASRMEEHHATGEF